MADEQSQQGIWEREHTKPDGIKQLDGELISQPVLDFISWMVGQCVDPLARGVSVCCGKGRNEIGAARLGYKMVGLDFSKKAIDTARERAAKNAVTHEKTTFLLHDVTTTWPLADGSFDFGIDSFALADIEDPEARKRAAQEMVRVLRPGGYLLVYTLSNLDEWSIQHLDENPLSETNTYRAPPNGKFEKCFLVDEIVELYEGLYAEVIDRVQKTTEYSGVKYKCNHHWIVLRKPVRIH